MNLKKILCPTDFSDSSDFALEFASSLAAETGSLLQIIHVGNESSAYLAGYGDFGTVADLVDREMREHRALLEQVRPSRAKVNFEHRYLSGSPGNEILAFAERENVDLIVLGSHGRTGLTRLLLGSVAEAVVRRAKCPVLTVKQPITEDFQAGGDQEHSQPCGPRAKHSLH